MRLFRIFLLLSIVFVVFLAESCKKQKSASTISLESVLTMKIANLPSDNVNPYTQETYNYVGNPGYIAYAKNEEIFPFLVIGKKMKKNDSYLCHFIGVVGFELEGEKQYMGIAFPVEDRFKTLEVSSYKALSSEYSQVKMWISDWIRYAFKKDNVSNISWSNETEIYRRLYNENTDQ